MIKGQLQCHHSNDQHDSVSTANSIGRYSVIPAQKWSAIFSSYHQLLCLPDPISHDILKYSQISKKSTRNDNKRHDASTSTISVNTPVVWEQIAIQINQNKNQVFSHKRNSNACEESRTIESHNSSVIDLSGDQGLDLLDCLEIIPDYYHTTLTSNYYKEVTSYLKKAFSNKLHPLANLLNTVTDCYTATYGGVRIHPRLLRHAVDELNSLVNSLYYIVCAMFPALPKPGHQLWIDFEKDSTGTQQNEEGEMVTPSSIMHPHILPKIHPSIFMLYALHYKKDDDEYWLRILKWNRHPDIALLSFLGVDQKFWCLDFIQNHQHDKDAEDDESLPPSPVQNYSRSISLVRDNHFVQAIETLQQLKTNFTPFEKLTVILETFREVNKTGLAIVGKEHVWSMDDLFPVFQYIVVRARILQLGAEIHMIEDLMESHHMLGEYGIMFTTLQASYYQILKESLSIV
jgi:amyotrophic lateral sclerosis 2 protein